jgi:hypothetical protein
MAPGAMYDCPFVDQSSVAWFEFTGTIGTDEFGFSSGLDFVLI